MRIILVDGPAAPVLERVAKRLEKDSGKKVTLGQVSLKWAEAVVSDFNLHHHIVLRVLTYSILKGDILVVTSHKPERLQEYLATGDLPDLTQDEVKEITEAGKKLHFRKVRKVESRLCKACLNLRATTI
jgi:hypothetical protein